MSKYFGVIIFHYEFSERLSRTTERKNIRSVYFFKVYYSFRNKLESIDSGIS